MCQEGGERGWREMKKERGERKREGWRGARDVLYDMCYIPML